MFCENLPLFVAVIFLLVISRGAGGDIMKQIRCRDNERQALLDFKKEIAEDYGSILSSWRSQEEECCKWSGIRCSNRTGHVISLDLQGLYDGATDSWAYVIGKVSPSLRELNHLKYLDLSRNDFQSSPIPNFIGSLSKLQHLNLSWSSFAGRVPPQLGNLTNLRSLGLGLNYGYLTVENLEWLSDLRLLRHLDLGEIDLQKVDWLQSIDRLSFLSELHLSECNLPGIISPSLHLTNFSNIPLSMIDLTSNSFTNSLSYNWLFNFSSSLVEIDMSFNPLGGFIPDAFGNMMSLQSLSLLGCALQGEIPKSFMNLSHLKSLDLSKNNLTGQLPNLFQKLFASKNSLEILGLYENKVSGSLLDFDFTRFSSLRQLRLGRNKLNGSFPKRFSQSSPLEYLDLSENELNGSFPDLTSFPLLRNLYLNNNNLKGRLPKSIGKLSNLKELDLSFNLLTLEFSFDWTPRFQLDVIKLSNCKLGPHFPEWLRSQNNFSALYISSAGISDTIPYWFWHLSPRLQYLSISNNQIHGMLPDLTFMFDKLLPSSVEIDLSSNRFKGPIPLFPRDMSSLNLSKNMFSGSIISLCTIATNFLNFLILSDNLLSGEVPDCWIGANELMILDLANNNFSQKIPASFGFLNQLNLLNLRNNSFIGEFPSSLKNCSSLRVIDMSENKLSGQVPAWIGTHLRHLVVLSFRRNEFHGSIPPNICLLNNTQVLDLSQNKISGHIPQCFDKIYSFIQIQSSSIPTSLNVSRELPTTYYGGNWVYQYVDIFLASALVQWKGKLSEYKNTLGLLKCIDLSSNRLVGQIPQELASLEGLISLNLSRNNLTGHIIQKISQMKMLEILDLSKNQISGAIPIGLGSLHFLSVLDLSSNNFSGKIPLSTQLQTFNASVYAGNDKLCGLPLPNKCPEDETTSFPPPTDHGKDEDTLITTGFYVSLVLGFAVGFWYVAVDWVWSGIKLLISIQGSFGDDSAFNTAYVFKIALLLLWLPTLSMIEFCAANAAVGAKVVMLFLTEFSAAGFAPLRVSPAIPYANPHYNHSVYTHQCPGSHFSLAVLIDHA
ncbi:hypothetical protein LguiB_020615 [Lonicera macranthoides]